MNEATSLLQELEDAVSQGSAQSRSRALWYATDLLIAGRYSEDHIWIFGEVIGQLAVEIEVAARAKLANKMAGTANAPANLIRQLAADDSIEVAGPVLRKAPGLDVTTLVANARSRSQQHLLAISRRETLSEAVTDVLVTRGNQQVVHSVAANPGARFSESGFMRLLQRSENDSILAETLGQRRDIPRHLFQQLIARASEEVKSKLEREHPEIVAHVQTLVTDVTGAMHSKFGPASQKYFAAKKLVAKLHQYGNLNEDRIFDFAQARKIEESIVGLSLLCALPADVVERVLMDSNREMLLVLARAIDFSWESTMALLFLGASDHRIGALELDELGGKFARLNGGTSRSVLDFYRSRKATAAAGSGPSRLPRMHA